MAMDDEDRNITFESNNLDVSPSLREYGHSEILKVAEKYFGRLVAATVHFSSEGIDTRCTVNVQMGGLDMITGEALAKNMRLAFDQALEKAAKQLRRAKREMREDKPARIDKGVLPDGSRMI